MIETGLVAGCGTEVGFARAGSRPRTLVLLHDWPQTSYAWRRVLPLLAEDYTVIALDLRGVGRSSPATSGFDKATMARDVCAALAGLGIDAPSVIVGHGIGAMVGYALARREPSRVAGLVLADTALPGLPGWDEEAGSPTAWHLGFHRDTGNDCAMPLAEALVEGREAVYFRRFIDRFAARPDAISTSDIERYAQAYLGRDRLAAGFGMFRALPVDAEDNKSRTGLLAVPVLAVFGECSMGTLAPEVVYGLEQTGVREVGCALIADCGHWLAEEQPEALAGVIRAFAVRVYSS